VSLQNSKFKPSAKKLLINWGSSTCPYSEALNFYTAHATDKITAFNLLKEAEVRVPPFTTDKEKAEKWNIKHTVLARTLVHANSGKGIVVCNPQSVLPEAPLYVKYIPKKAEYRVHVVNGKAIYVQQKKLRKGQKHGPICTHAHGWIFATQNVFPPQDVVDMAVNAVTALKLDFGAVDVIWNEGREQAYVLEINTAPGIAGTTIEKYTEAFKHDYQ